MMATICPEWVADNGLKTYQKHSALAESFGYFEHSSTNTMALLRNVSPSTALRPSYVGGMH